MDETKEKKSEQQPAGSGSGNGFDFGLTADELNRKVKFPADGSTKEATLQEVLQTYAPAGVNFTRKTQEFADKVKFADDIQAKFGKTSDEIKTNIETQYWDGVQEWWKTDAGKQWYNETGQKLGLTTKEIKATKDAMTAVASGEDIPQEVLDEMGSKATNWVKNMIKNTDKAVDDKVAKLQEAVEGIKNEFKTDKTNQTLIVERKNLIEAHPELKGKQTKLDIIEMYATKAGYEAIQKGNKPPTFAEVYEQIKDEISVPQSQLDAIKKSAKEEFMNEAKKVNENAPSVIGAGSSISQEETDSINSLGDLTKALSNKLGIPLQVSPMYDPDATFRKPKK